VRWGEVGGIVGWESAGLPSGLVILGAGCGKGGGGLMLVIRGPWSWWGGEEVGRLTL
jgi:hypothetical protein